MSTTAAAVLTALAVMAPGLAVTSWLVRRARLADAKRERILADSCEPTVHDVGPDKLRLLEDLEAHLKAYGNAVADFYDTTTTGD